MTALAAIAALAVALAARPADAAESDARPSPGCAAPKATAGPGTIQAKGLERRFFLTLPGGSPTEPRPLVFAFHPYTADPATARFMYRIEPAWPEAIVVYPEGLPRTIQILGLPELAPGWQILQGELDDRDLAFYDALRKTLLETACVDERRVYSMGFSNGAFFSTLLSCVRPATLAAIAAAGGGAFCVPDRPVPAIVSNGTADPLVRYPMALDSLGRLATGARCKRPDAPAPGCHAVDGCSTELVFCSATNEGHRWSPSFTRDAVDFFRRHPAP